MNLRVLVTGSRDYPYPERVIEDLWTLFHTPELAVLTVVHGDHPTGADRAAQAFCDELRPWAVFFGKDVIPEPHPAAWGAYGKAAGPIRNSEMVDLGAHLCLAYPIITSTGTIDCMTKAIQAGIMVVNKS